jgi:cell adhesion molecule, putative (fragment)
VPSAGPIESLLTLNSTFVLVHLSSWLSNGCPILSFLVQYREHHQPEWIMLSNNILPKQNQILISDLNSATWYELLIIATSEAGSTESQYLFATLTSTGGKNDHFSNLMPITSFALVSLIATIAPLSSTAYSNWKFAFNDPIVLAPIFCTIFVFIIIFAIILFISNSRSQSNQNETR